MRHSIYPPAPAAALLLLLSGCVTAPPQTRAAVPVHASVVRITPTAVSRRDLQNFLLVKNLKRWRMPADIPSSVVALFPGSSSRLAAPKEPFNSGDAADVKTPLCSLIFAQGNDSRCLVIYQKGGFIPFQFATLFSTEAAGAHPLWSGLLARRVIDLQEFMKALHAHECDDAYPDPLFIPEGSAVKG